MQLGEGLASRPAAELSAPGGGWLRQWFPSEWGLTEREGGKGRGHSFSRGPFMLKSASVNAGGPGAQPGEM